MQFFPRRFVATGLAALIFITAPAQAAEAKKKEEKMSGSAADISNLAPEFVKLTKEFLFGDIWKRPGLTAREKSLVTITILATLGRTEQIDYHLGFGMDNGLTQEEIVAALTHTAFYAGWPSAMTGLTHLKKVLDERKGAKK